MIERVAVVGAGRMGVGMALSLSLAGLGVELIDLKERTPGEWASLEAGIAHTWREELTLLGAPPLPPPALRQGYGPWLTEPDALFEALPERLDLKRAAYQALSCWLKPTCLVASTTSSFAPDELAPALTHPKRFLVAHWLHPPTLMPLVEVAPCQESSPESLTAMTELLRRARKEPVQLKGLPGLVVARLQVLIMNEAARLAAEGIAPPAEIDQAVRLGIGLRFLGQGLLAFADTGGIDVLYLVCQHLQAVLGAPRFEPAEAVAKKVAQGELGLRTGRGFYDWADPAVQAERRAALQRYRHLLDALGLARPAHPLPESGDST